MLCSNLSDPVRDLSGKPIRELTAFQAALCAGDVDMCRMFKKYFEKIPNSLETMENQISEIFPDGFPIRGNEDPPHVVVQKEKADKFVIEALTEASNAIIVSDIEKVDEMIKCKKADSYLGTTFAKFRSKVEELSFEDVIYNPYYFLKAITFYNERFDSFPGKKRDLFYVQLIGFIQRYLPACYLQAFAQGPAGPLLKRETLLDRSFKFDSSSHLSEDELGRGKPLRINPVSTCSGLGFDYCAGTGVGQTRAPKEPGRLKNRARMLEAFFKRQNEELRKFTQEMFLCQSVQPAPGPTP